MIKMSRNNPSVKKNYIWNTSYQILNLIVPLITAPYLARVLGANGTGIYSYIHSMVAYFTLFAVLGTSVFGQRNIAYVRDDKEARSRAFYELLIFRTITSILALAAYGVFIRFSNQYKVYYVILSMNIINTILDISWFYQGIEDFKRIVIRNLIVRVFHTAFIFLFVKNPDDLWLYIASIVGFSALGNISMWFTLPKYLCRVKGIDPFRDIKDIILLFLPTIATQVYIVLDKSMIGWITESTYQNGCYEQSEKIARIALTVVTSAAMVVLPRVANLFKDGRKEEATKYIYKGYRFTLFLSMPIMCGIIGVSKVFVPVFFGEGYEMAEILMPIFSVLVVAVSLAYITGYSFLISTGQQNIYTIAVSIAAGVNFLLNICMIPKFGAIGAAMASVLAEIIGVSIQIIYCCVTRQLRIKNIFASTWKYILSASGMLVQLLYLQNVVTETAIGLLTLIVVGSITYAIILVVLRDDFFIQNFRNICGLIRNKFLGRGN